VRVQLTGRRPGEEGAVAIVVAILSTVLLVIAAFTTDFGMALAKRQALSTGVDGAALAIVQAKFADEIAAGSTLNCNDLKAADNALPADDSAKAVNIALREVNANAPFGQTLPSSAVHVQLDCVGDHSGVLQATVSVEDRQSTGLGHLANVSSIPLHRVAAAALGPEKDVVGVEPLGICLDQAKQIMHDALAAGKNDDGDYPAALISPTKVWGTGSDCNSNKNDGSGNWGWLDLGQGNGNKQLSDVIAEGYDGKLTLSGGYFTVDGHPVTGSPGNKGNSSNVDDGFTKVMDKVVTLPVYDSFSGNGSGTTFHVLAFLTVQMCGWGDTIRGACYDDTDPSVAASDQDLQIRYVAWTAEGDLDPSGKLGDPNAFSTYTTGLVR
jgi:hypothetical protein